MIAIEITGAKSASEVRKFYFSDTGFCTSPTDTPPNQAFVDRIIDSGRIGINSYSDGRTGGGTRLEIGQIVIANVDGRYDDLLNYSFDGREIVIRSGPEGAAYPAGFQVIMRGTMEALQADFDKLTFQLRDKQFMFDQPLLTVTYAGTNILPNGVEGVAADLKGKVKPMLFGRVNNISPPLVNTSKLTYQVSNGSVSNIPAVYDRGVALNKGANYATLTQFESAGVTSSTFITCLSLGLFRLGTVPSGTVTCDAVQSASVTDHSAAQLMRQVALYAGLPADEISAADVAALDAINNAEAGIWVNDSSKVSQVLDALAASITGWYSFDGAGLLRMGRLTAPTGVPVATITENVIYKSGMQRRTPKDNGLPVWQVKATYDRNYTEQKTDLAGSVTAVRRAYLMQETRTAEASSAAVKDMWKLSSPLEVDTLLVSAVAAQAEAARLLELHQMRREVYDFPVDINSYVQYNLKLMDLIKVVHPRFGMSEGRLFRLIGYRIELNKKRVILVVWG